MQAEQKKSMSGETIEFEESEFISNDTFPLEMDKYFSWLELAIYFTSEGIAKFKDANKVVPPSYSDGILDHPSDAKFVDEFFINFFLSRKDKYENSYPFKLSNKRYPIFGDSVFINIPLAAEYDKIETQEMKNLGALRNGEANDFLYKNEIATYQQEDIKNIFNDPDLYRTLRREAFAAYKKANRPQPRAGIKSQFASQFETKVTFLQKLYKLNSRNMYSMEISSLIGDEINKHLLRFGNDKYTAAPTLNKNQKVILMLFFLESVGFHDIRPTDFAEFMQLLFDENASGYRKLVTSMRTKDNLGYQDPETCGDAKEAIMEALKTLNGRGGNSPKIIKKIQDDLINREKEIFSIIPKR